MKYHTTKLIILAAVASLLFVGYQCGSPEFTGAKVHIQQRNFKEAARLLEIEVQKNPQNEEAWFFLGGLKADQGDLTGMTKAFDAALKISPKHAGEIRAMRYNQWGQNLNAGVSYLERATSDSVQYFEKSIDFFHKAIAAWPDTSLTYRYLGFVYNNKGDYDNALVAFKKAWDMGKDLESIKRAGAIYLIKGDEHKGKFETENAVALKDNKNFEEAKRVSTKDKLKDALGLPDSTKKVAKNSTKEVWTYNKFKSSTFTIDGDKIVDRKLGDFKAPVNYKENETAQIYYGQAVKALEAARDAEPTARLAKGMSEAEVTALLGQPSTKTQAVFENTNTTLWTYSNMSAQVYFSEAKVVGFVRPAPDNEILQRLLKAYVESNKIEPAVREFQKAVAADPANKTNHFILGVLYRTIGKFDEAIASFKQANTIDPNDCDVLFDIAATYYNWGVDMIKTSDEKNEQSDAYKAKFQAALPYMERVADCKKEDANIWETMGTIYARLGLQEKAMKAFEQADWIRKKSDLKIGMSESEVVALWGQSDSKIETVYEQVQSLQWTYGKHQALLYFVEGKLKGWVRSVK